MVLFWEGGAVKDTPCSTLAANCREIPAPNVDSPSHLVSWPCWGRLFVHAEPSSVLIFRA